MPNLPLKAPSVRINMTVIPACSRNNYANQNAALQSLCQHSRQQQSYGKRTPKHCVSLSTCTRGVHKQTPQLLRWKKKGRGESLWEELQSRGLEDRLERLEGASVSDNFHHRHWVSSVFEQVGRNG